MFLYRMDFGVSVLLLSVLLSTLTSTSAYVLNTDNTDSLDELVDESLPGIKEATTEDLILLEEALIKLLNILIEREKELFYQADASLVETPDVDIDTDESAVESNKDTELDIGGDNLGDDIGQVAVIDDPLAGVSADDDPLAGVCQTPECLQVLKEYMEWRQQNGYPAPAGKWGK